MNDTIYLICTKKGVDRMVKTKRSATALRKGEVPVKLKIEVPDENWKPPFIEKQITVNRWDENIDVEDVDFEGQFVTEEEAELIRQERLDKMKRILEKQGYTVTRYVEIEEDEEP
ncbi:hypothetical protein [Halalkalibaculum sp. DA384]|uniref:hypothetical protein n=1 Tax=Halalkalibaculum sp. DA384 TaxID=3373606 RepID=UPI003755174B